MTRTLLRWLLPAIAGLCAAAAMAQPYASQPVKLIVPDVYVVLEAAIPPTNV